VVDAVARDLALQQFTAICVNPVPCGTVSWNNKQQLMLADSNSCPQVILLAAWLGHTRLLDNLEV
jgi:pantothenate synthetase